MVNTVTKKRIVSLTVQKKKRKSVPTRAPSMCVPSECELLYTDNNGADDDDNNDDEKNTGSEDRNGKAAQETTDDEGREEGNGKEDNSSDSTSETSSNRKRRRLLQAAEEDDNGAEWEEAVNVSLTRTGHRARAAVQPTYRNAILALTNLPNLTTGRASMLNLDAAIQICSMSKTVSLKNQQPHVAQRVRAFVKAKLF